MDLGGRTLLIAGLLAATGVAEGSPLRLEGSVVAQDPPAIRVIAHNTGETTVRDVTPTVAFEHQSYRGVPASLDAGAHHEWRLGLPPPSQPGTSAATVRTEWMDVVGARHALPLVVLVSAATELPPDPVELVWTLEPAAPVAHTRVRLENRGPRPVVGRLAFVLPGELTTEPEGQPVTIPARAGTTVPVAIESRGAESGSYPAYALFTYTDADRRRAALTAGELTVARAPRGERAMPLAIGGGALILAFALLAVALRASRRVA